MRALVRALAIVVAAALLWPELGRYRAEWTLSETNARLDRALRGVDRGAAARESVAVAATSARAAATHLPGDARAPLLEGIALILIGDGVVALRVLDAAIAAGERPELTLNQGRARYLVGDAAGAEAAYLRTAWASPLGIESLPAPMREKLLAEVAEQELELRSGRMHTIPGG